MQSIIRITKQFVLSLEHRIFNFNIFNSEPIFLLNTEYNALTPKSSFSISELMKDGMLWGVPKKRPTIESRLKKRFGVPNYPQCSGILRSKTNIVTCEQCGDHHENHTICRTCYIEVKEETEKIKQDILKQTNPLEPKDKEIFLQFQNEESNQKSSEKLKIIEIDRPRPKWFSRNLLSKSTGSSTRTPRNIILSPGEIIEQK